MSVVVLVGVPKGERRAPTVQGLQVILSMEWGKSQAESLDIFMVQIGMPAHRISEGPCISTVEGLFPSGIARMMCRAMAGYLLFRSHRKCVRVVFQDFDALGASQVDVVKSFVVDELGLRIAVLGSHGGLLV